MAKIVLTQTALNNIEKQATGIVAGVVQDAMQYEYLNATRENGHNWGSERLAENVKVYSGKSKHWVYVNSDGMSERWGKNPLVGDASFHEFGTGEFGPKRRRITARNGKMLRFVNRRGSRTVTLNNGGTADINAGQEFYMGSVRGMRPSRPITKAVRKVIHSNSNVRGRTFTK